MNLAGGFHSTCIFGFGYDIAVAFSHCGDESIGINGSNCFIGATPDDVFVCGIAWCDVG